jgi:hypothetical protein
MAGLIDFHSRRTCFLFWHFGRWFRRSVDDPLLGHLVGCTHRGI